MRLAPVCLTVLVSYCLWAETPARVKPEPQFHRVFNGTLDGRSDMQLTLNRKGADLSGVYVLEDSREPFLVRGTLASNGQFTLQEFDLLTDKPTGSLKGKLSTDASQGLVLDGTATKLSGRKPMPFCLTEQQMELAPNLRMAERSRTEESRKPAYKLDVHWPVLEGVLGQAAKQFNQQIRAIVDQEVTVFKDRASHGSEGTSELDLSFEIAYSSAQLISVAFLAVSEGPAYRPDHAITLNYQLSTNQVLSLASVFRPNTDFTQIIGQQALARLRRQDRYHHGRSDELDALAIMGEFPHWTVGRKGIVLYFAQNQLMGGPESTEEFFVPYSLLKPMLLPNGPLARVVLESGMPRPCGIEVTQIRRPPPGLEAGNFPPAPAIPASAFKLPAVNPPPVPLR